MMTHMLLARRAAPRMIAALAGVLFVLLLAACSGGGDVNLEVKSPNGTIGAGQSYDFGTVTVGSTRDAVFTIMNRGNDTVDVDSITLEDGTNFTIVQSGSVSLAAGETKSWTINFRPSRTGSISGDATVWAGSFEQTFTLSGTGQSNITPELLAPPAWIQGTWRQEGSTATSWNQYVFSADNVINTSSSGTSINFKTDNQTYAANMQANTGWYDSEPSGTTYQIESRVLGSVIATFSFYYGTATSMTLSITGGGAGGPYTFNKQ